MPYRGRTVVRKALLLALAGAQWNPAIAATTTGSLVDAIRRNDLAVARRVSGPVYESDSSAQKENDEG
ncbi:MAG: hypothetical protein ABJC89_20365, partial [Acidobacteriota bacterium]